MRLVQGGELITFNRDAAAKKGQEAVYLTGRAALPRERDSRMLMEVAAGVDVRKGVLTLIEFPNRVSRDLWPMASDLFAGE